MELVTAAEAARQLGVHPSQITRGIQSGLIPNRAPPNFSRPMVNVDEARTARRGGIDRSKQRGPGAPLFAPGQPQAEALGAAAIASTVREMAPPASGMPADAEPADADEAVRDPSYQASRARRESAAAAKAEIELAQLRAKTLDRAEVADAAFRLGQMLREGMETRRVALANRLAGLDVAAMIRVLADADAADLTALADAIERELSSEEGRVAA